MADATSGQQQLTLLSSIRCCPAGHRYALRPEPIQTGNGELAIGMVVAPIEALARSLFEALDQIAALTLRAGALKSIVHRGCLAGRALSSNAFASNHAGPLYRGGEEQGRGLR
jgi:hypothetical protein